MDTSNTTMISLNNSEMLILKETAELGEVSAYDIAKKTNKSYPSIFRYCKSLYSQGVLTSRIVIGEKNSEKALYKLSFLGLVIYLGEYLPTTWDAFGFPFLTFSGHRQWFNTHIGDKNLSNWLDTFLKTLTLYSDYNPVFNISNLLKNSKNPQESLITLVGMYTQICKNIAFPILGPNGFINQDIAKDEFYAGIEECVFDIINQDAPPPAPFIDIIHSFVEIPELWRIIEGTIYFEFNYLIEALSRFNSLLPNKNEYIDSLKKIDLGKMD